MTAKDPSYEAWIALSLLEVAFFVNAAGLFMLSALIEKNKGAQKIYKDQIDSSSKPNDKLQKEITSVKMPPALIEGFESFVLFGLIILLPDYQVYLYAFFCIGVWITIL